MGEQAETLQGNVGLLFENAPVGRKTLQECYGEVAGGFCHAEVLLYLILGHWNSGVGNMV